MSHYNFAEQLGSGYHQMNKKDQFSKLMRSKIMSIFRHGNPDDSEFSVGVILQNGEVRQLKFIESGGKSILSPIQASCRIQGDIISVENDREH